MSKSRSKIGKASRIKGKTWERQIVKDLKHIFGNCVYRGHQNTHGGYSAGEGCDVEGTPYYIEAKHRANVNPRDAVEQAEECREKTKDERPVVAICKIDRKKPTVTMRLCEFVQFADDWLIWTDVPTEKEPLVTINYADWLMMLNEWEKG
jgi:hypothetical protein